MENSLGGEDGLDKGSSTGRIDVLTIPSDKLAGHFVLKRLEIHSFKFPNRKRESQVFDRKGRADDRQTPKNIIKIDFMAMYWNDRAFLEVSMKTGRFTEIVKNGGEV
jgi:hypothetical protein